MKTDQSTENRSVRLNLCVTPTEKRMVDKEANRQMRSVSDYLRLLLLDDLAKKQTKGRSV